MEKLDSKTVTNLVQQLKRGNISKTDLFSELTKLHNKHKNRNIDGRSSVIQQQRQPFSPLPSQTPFPSTASTKLNPPPSQPQVQPEDLSRSAQKDQRASVDQNQAQQQVRGNASLTHPSLSERLGSQVRHGIESQLQHILKQGRHQAPVVAQRLGKAGMQQAWCAPEEERRLPQFGATPRSTNGVNGLTRAFHEEAPEDSCYTNQQENAPTTPASFRRPTPGTPSQFQATNSQHGRGAHSQPGTPLLRPHTPSNRRSLIEQLIAEKQKARDQAQRHPRREAVTPKRNSEKKSFLETGYLSEASTLQPQWQPPSTPYQRSHKLQQQSSVGKQLLYAQRPDMGRAISEGNQWSSGALTPGRGLRKEQMGPGSSRRRPKTPRTPQYRMNGFSNGDAQSQKEIDVSPGMAECTFQPKIRKLPSSYGAMTPNRLSVAERTNQWLQRREAKRAERSREMDNSKIRECTFTPKLSTNSRRLAGSYNEPIGDRLYQKSFDHSVNKALKIEDLREELEMDFEKTCTFKPKLRKRSNSFHGSVSAKVWKTLEDTISAGVWAHEKPGLPDPEGEECTFTPQIKGLKPNMPAASMYCGMPVVERLTMHTSAPATDCEWGSDLWDEADDERSRPDHPVVDVQSFLGSLQGNDTGSLKGKGSFVGERTVPRVLTPHTTGRKRLTEEERAERRRSFNEFLVRNQHTMLRKEQKVAELFTEEMQEMTLKPEIAEGSKKIIENQQGYGDFLVRMSQEQIKKEHRDRRRQTERMENMNLTFKPQVNEVSRRLQGRSILDMSLGDSLRMETKRRLLKLKVDEREISEMTFRPDLSKSNATDPNRGMSRSRIEINSNPDSYMARIKKEAAQKKKMQDEAKQRQEMLELEECTYNPQIKNCPAYVQKIAESMAVARAAREQPKQLKPEWK